MNVATCRYYFEYNSPIIDKYTLYNIYILYRNYSIRYIIKYSSEIYL